MTIAPAGLAPRRCHLRESDHRYVWEPTGEEMAISVTGVCSFFKPPYDGPPEASWRGTHAHRFMYFKATGELPPGCDHLGTHSPEGVDCTAWIEKLGKMSFWDEIETLGCEYTMIRGSKSLGGQLDLLCRFKGKTLLVDLKTKGPSWSGPSKEDLLSYSQQAGGYLELLATGDDAHSPPWVDECRTLVVTPTRTKWLSAMQPDDCSADWQSAWGAYANVIKSTF